MEKKTDALEDLIEDLQGKTKEFLQPNPAARAKMAALKMSSSQAKSQYPQTEGLLGAAMVAHAKKLGDDGCLAQSLTEFGDSMKQIADVKYSLDNNVKQNFLDPLNHLQNNEMKEVQHHRKVSLGGCCKTPAIFSPKILRKQVLRRFFRDFTISNRNYRIAGLISMESGENSRRAAWGRTKSG